MTIQYCYFFAMSKCVALSWSVCNKKSLPSCWRKQKDPVSPRTVRSSASRCHHYLQTIAHGTTKRQRFWLTILPSYIITNINTQRREFTHSAGVALQKLDLLKEFDVVGPQAVQLTLKGLHGLLHGATLLWRNRHSEGPGVINLSGTRT